MSAAQHSRQCLLCATAGHCLLCDAEDNVWRAAWNEQNFSNALTPMFVPAEGEALLSARDALTLNEPALAGLAVFHLLLSI